MLFVTIVLDGVGVGAQADADKYGDEGSNTLGHVCEQARPDLPNLTRLGLGCILPLPGIPPAPQSLASFGRMQEVSTGKDSTTGHWELAGLLLQRPFPTYPDGFPTELINRFVEATGCRGILGNKPASGTAIITELGEEHQASGFPVVYTSADSVFQVAAHVDTVPAEDLYRMCRIAREEVCTGKDAVGRVIARPFEGSPDAYKRISAARKDYALPPDNKTLQEALQFNGVRTVAIGKISDLFAGVGFDAVIKTKCNEEGIATTLEQVRSCDAEEDTFIWTNLVDFDQEYGHRNDVGGFARALEVFDRAIPELLAALPAESRLVITADHGNDPTTPSTDHSREYVPLLYYGAATVTDLGLRRSFNDHAATVASYFGAPFAVRALPFESTSRQNP